jgi:hypothetical protein
MQTAVSKKKKTIQKIEARQSADPDDQFGVPGMRNLSELRMEVKLARLALVRVS